MDVRKSAPFAPLISTNPPSLPPLLFSSSFPSSPHSLSTHHGPLSPGIPEPQHQPSTVPCLGRWSPLDWRLPLCRALPPSYPRLLRVASKTRLGASILCVCACLDCPLYLCRIRLSSSRTACWTKHLPHYPLRCSNRSWHLWRQHAFELCLVSPHVLAKEDWCRSRHCWRLDCRCFLVFSILPIEYEKRNMKQPMTKGGHHTLLSEPWMFGG